MLGIMTYFSLSDTSLLAITLCFAVICLALFALRLLTQFKARQTLAEELARRDNFALGISYASNIFSVILVVGYLFDDISLILMHDKPWKVALLLFLMLFFVATGQTLHRKWILSQFNEEKAILKQNICAAVVDSGMLIANCTLILGLFNWSHSQGFYSILVASISFLMLQCVFYLDSKLREWRFASANQGASLQGYFNLENTSIGIRYAGKTIGLGLALYAGLASAHYHSGKLVENLFTLALHCGLMWLLISLISRSLTWIVLYQVNTETEIDHQDNIGVACIEFTLYGAVGYLLIKFLAH